MSLKQKTYELQMKLIRLQKAHAMRHTDYELEVD